MADVIATSTTDVVPVFAHRTVVRSAVTWAPNHETLADAHATLTDWARTNGYHAVVGVRFEVTHAAVPAGSKVLLTRMNDDRTIRGDISSAASGAVRYLAYGTAVEYAPE